ncbi:hypothetical protein FB446DRAFT_707332 [Lentinula raphanica]|nr:hypothetical protein FB446DRAFT_707332 [Lentinula raphanica]
MLAQGRPPPRSPNNPDLVCTNPNCRGRGHTIENCWKLGGGKQGQYPKWWKGKPNAPLLNPSANTTTTSANPEGAISNSQIYALSTSNLEVGKTPVVPQEVAKAFADSGATAHFFHDRAVFRNYVERKGTVGHSSKKGVQFDILGQGDVDIRIIHNNVAHTLTFQNVFHAPSIASNLISIGLLDKLGWTAKIALTARSMSSPADKNLWHCRFGHTGVSRIGKAIDLLDGLDIRLGDILKCEDCTVANHKKCPFDGGSDVKKEPLERVYLDIFGLSQIASVGGNFYAMVLVDGGISKKFSYFTPNRTAETTLSNLNEFTNTAERQTGYKLKRVQDGGVRRMQPLPMSATFFLRLAIRAPSLRKTGPESDKTISEETGISKFDEHSIKCNFIGYESPGLHRCKVMGSDEVVRSRDTVFEEGPGHWTSEVEGEMDEDTNVDFLNYPTPKPTETENSDNQNQVMDTGYLGNQESEQNQHELENQHPSTIIPSVSHSRTKRPPTEPTRRSSRLKKPTRASTESIMYQEDEEGKAGQDSGEKTKLRF